MSTRALKAVVLAAGKGTRMQGDGEDSPKVMHQAVGRPLLRYVLDALDFVDPSDVIIVVGYKKEQVISAFGGYSFAVQQRQLGTGHAVMAAYSALGDFDGELLICYGDMPLIKRQTYRQLCDYHRQSSNACTILTGSTDIKLPYGRVLRDENGAFTGIVEDKDCTPEQRQITELNSGVYMFDSRRLAQVLAHLGNDNAQGEYYLTDAPLLMLREGMGVGTCTRDLGMEIIGVNTPEQLRQVGEMLMA